MWAEENTRASIWDAMYRKETFGVSGPHIKVRLFGGWGYNKDLLSAKDWVHQSYASGVPMGADLPAMPATTGAAPTFVVWAVKDPSSGNLDRIQVIKGWSQNGQSFEKIYDVVWAGDRKPDPVTGRVPAIQSTVDLEKATYTNSVGSTELKTVWTDPEFDASLHAFYYVRVLEIPTPRWTLIQSVKAGVPPPDVVPLTGQERAWTSPIWYTPSAEARKGAPAGMTVADLQKKGATALGDAQLKALIVGKAFWFRNNVTGEAFSQNFTTEGQTVIFHAGRNATLPSATGNLIRDGYQGVTSPYKIEGGKLITWISQEPNSVAVYKLGDKYYGARSNEFGYANYQIIPDPAVRGAARCEANRRLRGSAGPDGTAEAADHPDPQGRGPQAEGAEERRLIEWRGQGAAVARDRQRGGCQDHPAPESGTAAEVPRNARASAASDPREGRRRADRESRDRGHEGVLNGSPRAGAACAAPARLR